MDVGHEPVRTPIVAHSVSRDPAGRTMSQFPEGPRGLVSWELLNVSTGRTRAGQKELLTTDFEVVVYPPPPPPRFELSGSGVRQTVADAIGWLIKGGRGSTMKRVRLGDGFWLVLRERRSPVRAPLVLLSARRDVPRLVGMERFRVDEEGGSASQAEGGGRLGLRWAQDGEGFHELVSTTALTDVSMDLRTPRGPVGRAPVRQVRVSAGSVIRWPSAADGVRLVPRLRP